MEFCISTLEELPVSAKDLLAFIGDDRLVLINGEMGVGKTTLVQALLKELGVNHPEGSPTYALINEYDSNQFGKIYHLDLYRLKDVDELYDIGIEEVLDEQSFCFVEWPDLLLPLLRQDYVELKLSLENNLSRKISAKKSPR